MSGARLGALLLALAAVAPALLTRASGSPPRARGVPAHPARLAAGAGREIAERGCLMCHSAMLITQQAKDSTGWEKTLALMEKWGAPVAPGEHPTLHAYLLQHYGPHPPR